ncbi:NO-inducible flavohemoprotein [Tolumonas lignilytica]|uniref:NO-inducible flavohemoprotein n=1 Tax=Tolumonas lignilytica TaxID=1283284 RepID=UPI0004B47927|nr:NO-inducible flavohemoprotein [Tolumonas lignilytica]
MNEQQKALVRATVPVLRSSGVALTSHFYNRMFTHNPELKNVFNQGHQNSGRQQEALAGAVLAYAENIDDPSVLLPVVERIAHKHVSLNIRAEHYAIVGKHLLASIQEVLGDAATPELIDAWSAAYTSLADLFINIESDLYQQAIDTQGGWTGWRPFRICRKVKESNEITSFYFEPLDGGEVPAFRPGQYISVRLYVAEWDLFQPRQYSLSDAPENNYLRISVKRESANDLKPEGKVSNLLHEHYDEGQIVELSAPYGDFYLNETSQAPVVLFSGGVGITPMVSILNHMVKKHSQREIHFVHSARSQEAHAFREHAEQLANQHNVRVRFFYDHLAETAAHIAQAPCALETVLPQNPTEAEYYLCGPISFMRHYISELKRLGVSADNIYAEAFGSGGV